MAGSGSVWAVDYEELFSITSGDVVNNNTTYAAYTKTIDERDFVITWGGNKSSVGTNKNNRSSCNLGSYSKYAVSPVTTSSTASAFACATSISDVSKITYTFNGGSNQTNTNVYLLYSSDNTTFSQITLTSGTQGATISSGTAYIFSKCSGYFALLFESTNTSGNWRIDNVEITFYKEQANKTATTTTIDATGITNTNASVSTTAGQLTASVTTDGTAVSGATVTWSSSDEAVATVDANGNVTLVADGTTTITASYAGDDTYSSSSDTYELTVSDPREDATLYFSKSTQTISVGEILAAPELAKTDGITVTYSSSDTSIATVDADGNVTGVAVGEATITASFAGDDTYKGKTASYKVIVKNIPVGALFYESVSGYTSSSDGTSGLTNSYTNLDSDNWDSFDKVFAGGKQTGDVDGHLKFGNSSNPGKAVTKGIALTGNGVLTYKVMQFNNNNTGELNISVSGATASGDTNVTGTAAWVEKTVYLTDATGSVVITFETTSTNNRIRVDDIMVVAAPATLTKTVTPAGWATYAPEYPVEFEDGEAYIVTSPSTTKTTLVEVSSVPAGTPVVLKGAGEHTLTVAASSTDVSSNCLHVSDGVSTPSGAYVLADGDYGVGFYLWTGSSALSAGKIYMQIPTGGAREFFSLDGEASGIDSLLTNNGEVKGEVYSLSGQRVAQPAKGLYIVNGKKVIIK